MQNVVGTLVLRRARRAEGVAWNGTPSARQSEVAMGAHSSTLLVLRNVPTAMPNGTWNKIHKPIQKSRFIGAPMLTIVLTVIAVVLLAYAAMKGAVWFLERGNFRRDRN